MEDGIPLFVIVAESRKQTEVVDALEGILVDIMDPALREDDVFLQAKTYLDINLSVKSRYQFSPQCATSLSDWESWEVFSSFWPD